MLFYQAPWFQKQAKVQYIQTIMINKKTIQEINSYTQKIRNFFNKEHFVEVQTPILNKIPGMEPHLIPFETQFTNKTKLYLNTSPELQMKKLLANGFDKIFNITKVFRNGEIGGPLHSPEFTMLEWYRKNANYKDIMDDCENLIISLCPSKTINYQNNQINLEKPWKRISTNDLFIKHCDINLLENKDFNTFKETAIAKNYDINGCNSWDDIFFKIFLNHIEKKLGFEKPTIVYDYPSSQAALAQKRKSEPFFAERFELYIAGVELANAFSELIDANEQRERLIEEQKLRKNLNKTVFDIDEEFLASLESITEPCSGIALGIDRLLMILLNKTDIKDVLLFPLENYLNK